jgi:hypothetical protein
MDANPGEPSVCSNCGEELHGDYCHRCGQPGRHYRMPLRELVTDLLQDLLTLDSRLFRSVVPLLLRPGFLTREFNEGRRIRYIPPLRLYLFVSVLFLVLLAVALTQDWVRTAVVVSLAYLFLALKRVYGETTRRTIGKVLLLLGYYLAFTVAFVGMILLSLILA